MPIFTDGFYEQSTAADAPGYTTADVKKTGDGTSSFSNLLSGGIGLIKDLGTAYLQGRATVADIEQREADADAARSRANAAGVPAVTSGGIDQKTLLIAGGALVAVVVVVLLVKK